MTSNPISHLLEPIPGDDICGTDLSFSSAFDEIREARRQDDLTLAQGDWEADLKTAEWPRVRELCEDILSRRSKDMQVAAWYTEAMARLIFSERPELEDRIYVAYCPERVLPGNVIYELIHNDRVIGGLNPESTDKAIGFYSQFVQGTLHRTNCRTAEMCKLTENSSRDVQIAFANELSLICDKAGINVWELINLANKHPRVSILQPGCGVGGHCIAIDPYFITADFPAESKLIADAREINNYKSFWCAEKVKNAMLEFELKHHRKPCVAMMGLAFKPNIDDLRESPAKYITTKVMQSCNNANILVVEPNVKEHHVFKLTDYKEAYDKADIVVFLTAHTPFKELEWREDKVILDFCGIFKK